MNRILLSSSLFRATALMAEGLASGSQITPEVADRSEYEQVPTSTAPLKVAGEDHTPVATYAKQHEGADGKPVTTHLHIICHLGVFVLARRLEDQANSESDSHGIDPNVPAEMADHLEMLNSERATGNANSAGVPVDTTATVLPVAAPVAEFPPSPAPEDAPPAPAPTDGSSGVGDPESTDADTKLDPNQQAGQQNDI